MKMKTRQQKMSEILFLIDMYGLGMRKSKDNNFSYEDEIERLMKEFMKLSKEIKKGKI